MLQKLIEWVRHLLGIKPQPVQEPVDAYADEYADTGADNLTAVISNKLAVMTIGDSTASIEGEGARAEFLQGILERIMERISAVTAQAYGKGGQVLVPLVRGKTIEMALIDQNRVTVNAVNGGRPTAATILAQSTVQDDKTYYRLINYTLDGTTLTISQRVVNDTGRAVPLTAVHIWEGLTDEFTVNGCGQLPIGWLKCPRDNRSDESQYGVPITYGADGEMSEIREHLKWYRREFKLARPMLGMDASLWRNMEDMGIDEVKRTVQDDDNPFVPVYSTSIGDGSAWQHYAPAIRQQEFEGRLMCLYRRLEHACGLSQGILTERQSMTYATKDEIRSQQYDTFATVTAMRKNIEAAVNAALMGADLMAERFGLTPYGSRGDWQLHFDWDMSLTESTSETFAQMSELQARGLLTGAKLTGWVTGMNSETAEAEVQAARAETPGAGLLI